MGLFLAECIMCIVQVAKRGMPDMAVSQFQQRRFPIEKATIFFLLRNDDFRLKNDNSQVSNAFGSNIFDVLLGLGWPWMMQASLIYMMNLLLQQVFQYKMMVLLLKNGFSMETV